MNTAAAPTPCITARSSSRTSPISASIDRSRTAMPQPISDEGPVYADFRMDALASRLIGVSESTRGRERDRRDSPPSPGFGGQAPSDVLVEGADFYSDPIVSPDGKFLAWLQWNHPNMPWDGTELWVAVFNPDGASARARRSPAAASESIFQPEWSPDGALYFVRIAPAGGICIAGAVSRVEPLHPMDGGVRQAAVDVQHGDVCVRRRESHRGDLHRGRAMEAGADRSGCAAASRRSICRSSRSNRSRRERRRGIYFIGGSPTEATAICRYIDRRQLDTCCDRRRRDPIPREWISVPEAVTFTAGDRDVHAFYYPPTNPDVDGAGRRSTAADRDHARRADRRDASTCSIRRCSSGPAAASRCST